MKFQSTHPHGVRPEAIVQPETPDDISIHAPTWGATEFNVLPRQVFIFQSTHPHGVRQRVLRHIIRLFYFNPRTHMGCDTVEELFSNDTHPISIHAPTWGATAKTMQYN